MIGSDSSRVDHTVKFTRDLQREHMSAYQRIKVSCSQT